jgi:hypothetical protein
LKRATQAPAPTQSKPGLAPNAEATYIMKRRTKNSGPALIVQMNTQLQGKYNDARRKILVED